MYDFVEKGWHLSLILLQLLPTTAQRCWASENEFAVAAKASADSPVVKGDVGNNRDLTPENMDVIMKEGKIIDRGSF